MEQTLIEQKIKSKINQIEQKAQEAIKEKEQEDNKKIEQFIHQLKDCKEYEISKLIDDLGYGFENKVLNDKRVKEILFNIMINNYKLCKEIDTDTIDKIVGLSFSVFETDFQGIPNRLNLEQDKELLNRACVELLKRAEKEKDINIIIPLKNHLNQNNATEVRRKLDFMDGININDKEFSHNSVNAIYHYEQLLRWVVNKQQQEEIKNIIIKISKMRINNNIKEITEIEKGIRKTKEEIRKAKKSYPERIEVLTEKNNIKISVIQKKITKQEKLKKPFDKQYSKIETNLDKLEFYNIDWSIRNDLKVGKTKEAKKLIKGKSRINQIVDLLKQQKGTETHQEVFEKEINELKGEISSLEREYNNLRYDFNNLLEEKDKSIEETGWKINGRASSILEALLKLKKSKATESIDCNIDYYKYVEIVLNNADRDSDIELIKDVLPIIKERGSLR